MITSLLEPLEQYSGHTGLVSCIIYQHNNIVSVSWDRYIYMSIYKYMYMIGIYVYLYIYVHDMYICLFINICT